MSEHEAGRELDALVAEKVMGWKRVKMESQVVGYGASNVLYPDIMGTRNGMRTAIPHYSTDIAAAWEVVEKMKEKGFRFDLTDGADFAWDAFFEDKGNISSNAEADTAPLAICRAALSAQHRNPDDEGQRRT